MHPSFVLLCEIVSLVHLLLVFNFENSKVVYTLVKNTMVLGVIEGQWLYI
jgi:hypothetical protein